MILRTDILQKSCEKILAAVDSNVLNTITETLEIKIKDGIFSMAITNREYYVNIKFNANTNEELHATVDAILFLKLIGKVTSETIELTSNNNNLLVKCNGNYKLPLIYEDEKLLEIPTIEMDTVQEEFSISGEILNSIIDFNSKELSKGAITRPVQRLYYVDGNGCITFTSGACINKFNVNMNSKLLMNDKLIKLFRLFKKDNVIQVKVGHKQLGEDMTSTVIDMTADDIQISAILASDEKLFQGYPVTAIRGRVNDEYPYSISVNKILTIQAIDRLMLFTNTSTTLDEYLIKLTFNNNALIISDYKGNNVEQVTYANESNITDSYEAFIDSRDFSKTLQSCSNQIVKIHFGNDKAFLINEGNISWVIPQCYES